MDDSISRNRQHWEGDAVHWVERGRRNWEKDAPTWGIWKVPESELRLLDDVASRDVVELGCGAAYVSGWLARRGARAIGVDPTSAQLSTARSLQREFGVEFPLVQAAGEQVPLRSASFDLVISEYGAAIWADPHRWIPEAARLLRAGGELVFLGNSVLLMLCVPEYEDLAAEPALLRPQFGIHRFEWPDSDGVEFHISHGEMIRLLRANGFDVVDLVELRPGPDAVPAVSYVSHEWARRWPSEELWRARRR
ncbi:MAG TPA: class I SAM-dependent methyltransferase [Acidimicrobiales bacterium]|nr:class I SAM-dependent methyltransferase [Acidimicrobiales bacterium]